MATFFPICLLFTFQVEANLDIFFASVVLFLASPFGNLWRKVCNRFLVCAWIPYLKKYCFLSFQLRIHNKFPRGLDAR